MKKNIFIFVFGVLCPSLLLAWLAIGSLRDQQFVFERQQELLLQSVADKAAEVVQTRMKDLQSVFAQKVEAVISDQDPRFVAPRFDGKLRESWPLASVGFAVTVDGRILAPQANSSAAAWNFRKANDAFLCNQIAAEVYPQHQNAMAESKDAGDNASKLQTKTAQALSAPAPAENVNKGAELGSKEAARRGAVAGAQASQVARQSQKADDVAQLSKARAKGLNEAPAEAEPVRLADKAPAAAAAPNVNTELHGSRYVSNSESTFKRILSRSVAPEKEGQTTGNYWSSIAPAEAEFRQLVGESISGSVARFVDNRLSVMLWYRSPRDPQLVFGVELDLGKLIAELQPELEPELAHQVCLALIDDKGKPVARTAPAFECNWKRPFVATEIGEILPHWESAVYWLDPADMNRAVSSLRTTIGSLIAGLLGAIALGGWWLFADLRRQLYLARQKTDFVSNVSHELKTPLTSIRMFSELLADGRVVDPEKQQSYLQIICGEAARLTRLINNVLDFSRMERGDKQYHMERCVFAELVDEVVANYRPHLEASGFTLGHTCPEEISDIEVLAERDAICQVLVNLVSNAEKYGGDSRQIELKVTADDTRVRVEVLDRGLGVPAGHEERIFEEFHRADNSLSSGIQGAGLGLSLARRIAKAHGGDIGYKPRKGGGSCFYLWLPRVAARAV